MPTRILPYCHSRNPAAPSQITAWRPSQIRFICCDACPNPTFPTGALILEFCRQNLNRIKGG
jgi:hypothetical protein